MYNPDGVLVPLDNSLDTSFFDIKQKALQGLGQRCQPGRDAVDEVDQ